MTNDEKEDVQEEFFKNINHIEELTIADNPLGSLDGIVKNLRRLTILKIMRCPIRACPSSISELSALTSLQLCHTLIVSLPNEIGALTNLVSLDVGDNMELVSLPTTIGNLKALTHLNISGCPKLQRLPSQIGGCVSLFEVVCLEMDLAVLPPAVSQLPNIAYINASFAEDGNKLEFLREKQKADERANLTLWLGRSDVVIPDHLIKALVDMI